MERHGRPDLADDAGYLAIAAARKGPFFFIVDNGFRVIASRLEGPHAAAPRTLPADIARACRELLGEGFAREGTALTILRPGVILRLVRLDTPEETAFGVFIERYQQRDLIHAAARRYDLTTREIEVLDLLMDGEPTAAMASRLLIAETTVHQHVKNLGAKIGVTTRKGIVGTVLRST